MSKVIEMAGQHYGKLTVMSREPNSIQGKAMWLCSCECGNIKVASRSDIISGKVVSCGCFRAETASRQGLLNATHGGCNTRLYRIWCGMKQRTSYKKSKAYKNYGDRGVSVCSEWASEYATFEKWALANGYTNRLTIDRIDNNGNYTPDNCKWSTYKQQENNRRNNRKITVAGETHTVSEWSEISEISGATLCYRLNNGWPKEDLFMPASLNNKNIRKEIA